MKLNVKSGAVMGVLIGTAAAGNIVSMTKEWGLNGVAIGIGAGIGVYSTRKAS